MNKNKLSFNKRGTVSYSGKPDFKCKHCEFRTNNLVYLLDMHNPKQHGIKGSVQLTAHELSNSSCKGSAHLEIH